MKVRAAFGKGTVERSPSEAAAFAPLLRAPSSAPAPEAPRALLPRELWLDGRRYLLVPLDGIEPSNAAPATRSAPPAPPPEDVREEPARDELRQLSEREVTIVRLVAQGNVNKQIASELRISEHTVATHLRRIFAKLGVETRAAMVSRCFGSRALEAR